LGNCGRSNTEKAVNTPRTPLSKLSAAKLPHWVPGETAMLNPMGSFQGPQQLLEGNIKCGYTTICPIGRLGWTQVLIGNVVDKNVTYLKQPR
jgi:hypothetical protein